MYFDRTGRFYLTTFEYVFHESNALTTDCPSCGLRLIIKHDNFVNRATSLGVLIGISAFIGYKIGANQHWINQFCRKIFRFLYYESETEPGISNYNHRKLFRKLDYSNRISDASDSAVDFYLSDSEDFLDEQLACDKYYDDMFILDRSEHQSTTNQPYPSNRSIHSKTVDKIDQVLHQIDDIKKSIVEIDGELFNVSGYATFNPDFLTLTDYALDESETENPNLSSPWWKKRDNVSNPNHKFKSARTKRSKSIKLNPTIHEQFPIEKTPVAERQRRFSRRSFGSAENLQLEWDESEHDFCFHCDPLHRESTSSNVEMLPTNRDQFDPITSPDAVSEEQVETILMTDEQKLKSMQELLEEAKRLGLLNNIIDAFLNPSPLASINLKSPNFSDNEEEEL